MEPLPPAYGRVSLSLLAGQAHVNLLGNILSTFKKKPKAPAIEPPKAKG